jgi:hypothetical protein
MFRELDSFGSPPGVTEADRSSRSCVANSGGASVRVALASSTSIDEIASYYRRRMVPRGWVVIQSPSESRDLAMRGISFTSPRERQPRGQFIVAETAPGKIELLLRDLRMQ